MSIVGGPPPSLASDVDAEPRTITAATTVVMDVANMVEPFQDHPIALDILALGLSLQLSFRATWLATTRRAIWRSPPLPTCRALRSIDAWIRRTIWLCKWCRRRSSICAAHEPDGRSVLHRRIAGGHILVKSNEAASRYR